MIREAKKAMAAIGKELILGYQLRPQDSTLQHSFLLQPVEEERKENQSVIPVFNDLLLQAILGESLRLKVKSMENARCTFRTRSPVHVS